jgi:hypothetical protein
MCQLPIFSSNYSLRYHEVMVAATLQSASFGVLQLLIYDSTNYRHYSCSFSSNTKKKKKNEKKSKNNGARRKFIELFCPWYYVGFVVFFFAAVFVSSSFARRVRIVSTIIIDVSFNVKAFLYRGWLGN